MTVPIGTVISYMGPQTALAGLRTQGWLLCDGSIVAQTDYPHLYDVIAGTYGQPGEDVFNLPFLTGMFLRGVDPDGTVDPDAKSRVGPSQQDPTTGPTVGSFQPQQLLNHQHNWGGNFSQIGDGGNDISVQLSNNNAGNQGVLPTTNVDGGGDETRPINVYVYFLIYAGGGSDDSARRQ